MVSTLMALGQPPDDGSYSAQQEQLDFVLSY